MRKVALVFVLSVFLPSLVLAWLALGSLSNQRIVFESQQTLLYQGVCGGLVKDVVEFMSARQTEFARHVETLLAGRPAREVSLRFDEHLIQHWPVAEVGFAVSLEGEVLSPSMLARAETKRFRLDNDLFLSNQESVEVYWNSPKGAVPLSSFDSASETNLNSDSKDPAKAGLAKGSDKFRKVLPQKEPGTAPKPVSKVIAAEAEFRQLIGDATEGIIARFLQNRLRLLLWYRSPKESQLVFGAQLNLGAVKAGLAPLIGVPATLRDKVCVALIDDTGKPVAASIEGFATEWRRPFVAAEIGDVLPHWEIAAYLINPAKFSDAGRTLTLTLGLLIGVLIAAIAVGGWLVVLDLQRQLTLARQKTDFVSNVSHELKTPLTSIRMFSELLAEGRVAEEDKRRAYLGIITTEVARLTRLINNVLDFARLERGEKRYEFRTWDLSDLVRETLDAYRPHLERSGFEVRCSLPQGAVRIRGDKDALAQVLVNLLSNAEKYSADHKEITLELREPAPGALTAEVRVLDRGIGVPRGSEETIFEQFVRAHDALSSGIQGAGLGLTLARQIARAHHGDVQHEPREGGGSCFLLRLPLLRPS